MFCIAWGERNLTYLVKYLEYLELSINVLAFSIVVKYKNTLKCLSQFCKCYQNFFHGFSFV